jgi:hypothetical protein
MKLYIASSWRNKHQPLVVEFCKSQGHDVYDYMDSEGFHWSEVDKGWSDWDLNNYVVGLTHHRAEEGFRRDRDHIANANALILVLPCGRSAHLEAGVAHGLGKPLAIYIPQGLAIEPELMYKFAGIISDDMREIEKWLTEQISTNLLKP